MLCLTSLVIILLIFTIHISLICGILATRMLSI